MATRRMFSSRITESTRFIKMPATSQNLYFHLGMSADDDGVVEAYPIMRAVGSTEDDLRVLVSKELVTILNEDLVSYLSDWKEHNYIRADRKVDSIYKDLLLKVCPDAELIESKETYYSRTKNFCQTNGGQMTDNSRTNVGIGKDRIGKDKLSKDNIIDIGNVIELPDEKNGQIAKTNYQLITDMFNDICISFPKITKLSDTRKRTIKARLNSYKLDDFKLLFTIAQNSDFLKGKNNRNWNATFDWLIKDSNMAKVLDGNYSNKNGGGYNDGNIEYRGKVKTVRDYEIPKSSEDVFS